MDDYAQEAFEDIVRHAFDAAVMVVERGCDPKETIRHAEAYIEWLCDKRGIVPPSDEGEPESKPS
ncbi:MAG: hypothetical protein HRU11_12140, partial [Parvularculaceae bacterium]|nr:hypothetical protein [Parvularculaceae bacterium]